MNVRPILFSGAMVHALLAGTKTQTRRVVKPLTKRHPIQNLAEHGISGQRYSGRLNDPDSWGFPCAEDGNDMPLSWWISSLCHHGKVGDLLWVRETFTTRDRAEDGLRYDEPFYRAGADSYGLCFVTDDGARYVEDLRWTPAIHMPRSASRLTLRITDVRVQRLQDISADDCIAEGIEPEHMNDADLETAFVRAEYQALWSRINGERSWLDNPWVWAITFEVIKANVDVVLAQTQEAS